MLTTPPRTARGRSPVSGRPRPPRHGPCTLRVRTDARVVDEDREFRGAGEIRNWLDTAGRQFTYTRTLVGAEVIDTDTWLVVNHLEGDFPGGVVDLQYRFVVRDDLIVELVIAP